MFAGLTFVSVDDCVKKSKNLCNFWVISCLGGKLNANINLRQWKKFMRIHRNFVMDILPIVPMCKL